MCTGATFLVMAAAAVSAKGQMDAAKAQQASLDFQAQVASNNQTIALQNAADVRDRGEVEENEHRRRVKQTKGAARASQAANGFLVDDDAGSTNIDLLSDIEEAGTLDILRLRDNTAREARRAEIQGVNFQAQSSLLSLQSDSINPGLAAAGTLLAGAAKAATL